MGKIGGGLLVALVFVLLWSVVKPPTPHMETSDLYTHLSVARHLIQGDGFVTDIAYPLSFAFDFARELPQPLIHRGPGYPLLLTTVVAPSPEDPAQVIKNVHRLQLLFLGSIAVVGMLSFWSRKNVLATGIWLVFLWMSPLLRFGIDWAFVELPAGLLLLLIWLRRRNVVCSSPRWIDGLLAGLLVVLRLDLFWIPLLWWLWGRMELRVVARREEKTLPSLFNRQILLALGLMVLLNFPWAVRNIQLTGDPFFSLQSQAELVKDTRTWPGYSVYQNLEPQPMIDVLSNDPVPVARKFVRGLKFYFRNLGRLFPWAGSILMALALTVYMRGGINKSPCPLRPNAEYPMTIIPDDSPLGPLVVAAMTLILMIVQYSFFDHSLRHLLVLFPLIGWELANIAGLGFASISKKWNLKAGMMMISTLLVSWVLIHFTLQPVPGWEFAAEQATKQAPSLEKKTLALKLNAGQPAFVKTSAAPWFAHKAAVWDPENETTRQSISSHFNQPEATFADSLVSAAEERTQHSVVYDGAYQSLDYPGGDVADNRGVCTDVIIRSYRALGIDLQKLVHEDMVAHFSAYPNLWNMIRPDSNIDHRRVPNLQMFFQREGAELEVTNRAADYLPGDLVTWMLPGNLPHIGIVGRRISEDGQRHLVIHNVGRGPRQEDFLFEYDITGHYRWVN